jgi:hypothetical protein
MNKLIQISTALTADQFGCDVQHFSTHLRGRTLPVISETKNYVTVLDATGEEWTVNKADLSPKQNDEEILDIDPRDLPAIESGVQTLPIAIGIASQASQQL